MRIEHSPETVSEDENYIKDILHDDTRFATSKEFSIHSKDLTSNSPLEEEDEANLISYS